jgi:hypothetical protein
LGAGVVWPFGGHAPLAGKLPNALCGSKELDPSDYGTLQARLQEILRFLHKNHTRLFENHYVEVSPKYMATFNKDSTALKWSDL